MSMTIVERLRMSAEKDLHEDWYKRECREAADHIEELEDALNWCLQRMEPKADVDSVVGKLCISQARALLTYGVRK